MKGNLAVPGGPLTSKPTWLNTSRCSTTSAFFFASGGVGRSQPRNGQEPNGWSMLFSEVQAWKEEK